MRIDCLNDALIQLRPYGKWTLSGNGEVFYEDIVWLSEEFEKPEKTEVEALAASLAAQYEALSYQKKRKDAYPMLADFADAYYWAQNGDPAKMQEYLSKVEAVKTQFPKEVQ